MPLIYSVLLFHLVARKWIICFFVCLKERAFPDIFTKSPILPPKNKIKRGLPLMSFFIILGFQFHCVFLKTNCCLANDKPKTSFFCSQLSNRYACGVFTPFFFPDFFHKFLTCRGHKILHVQSMVSGLFARILTNRTLFPADSSIFIFYFLQNFLHFLVNYKVCFYKKSKTPQNTQILFF